MKVYSYPKEQFFLKGCAKRLVGLQSLEALSGDA